MADFRPVSFRRTRIEKQALPPGVVLIDQTRERTSWDEGMFVTSAHFNRDQSYVIARQGDLGQAIGAGVVEGLEVTQPGDDPTAVVVAPGLGIGGGGESIVVHGSVRIGLADIALQKSLTRNAGLEESLKLIAESRSGLFVLCATPVEYTSNPIGSYATAPDGQRRLRDSVVNEATLFTLVPFTLAASADGAEARRAIAARRIFLDGAFPDLPPTALPLAMMELDGNKLVWLDMHLARRSAGAARADAFGLGFVDTPARIAHYAQYDALIEAMVAGTPGAGFAAAERFDILPPMGRMPAACVAPRAPAPGLAQVLSHNWLPAEMPVELTALPEDEIAQLLEESLTMPPIDLHGRAEALAQTPVTVIVPIPRAAWADAPLEVVQQALTLQAAAPLGATPTTPMELIQSLLDQRRDPHLVDPTDDAAWLALLAGRSTLWYMRRRQFLRTDALTGEAFAFGNVIEGPGNEEPPVDPPVDPAPTRPDLGLVRDVNGTIEKSLIGVLTRLGLASRFATIRTADTAEGHQTRAELTAGLLGFTALGSDIILTDFLHRAADAGDLDPPTLRRLIRLYQGGDPQTRFVPFEGLLTGGVVDLVIPPFRNDSGAPRITQQFARTANGGTQPDEAAAFPVPANMQELTKRLLVDTVPDTVLSGLIEFGGAIPLQNARDPRLRIEIFKRALDLGMPLLARVRDPGSLEAQTRRNLLARAGTVPDLVQAMSRGDINRLFDPIVAHATRIERVFQGNATDAIRLVAELTGQITRG